MPAMRNELMLVAYADDRVVSVPLPDEGALTIGRSREADVTIDTPSLSRKHASVRVGPEGLEVSDLGSSNGTKLEKKPVPAGKWVPLQVGQLIELGEVMVWVQLATRAKNRPRIALHGSFEERLSDECRKGRDLLVVQVRALDRAVSVGKLAELLQPLLRPIDCLAGYAPSQVELLLPGAKPADPIIGQLTARLGEAGVQARLGIAAFGAHGRDAEQLIAHASAEVRENDEPADPGALWLHPSMKQLAAVIDKIAKGQINVLVTGETGAGKELVSEAIHKKSLRASGPFVRVNCGAISESLLESELFGHEKGAFTGATGDKPGLIEAANGGTLMLDEVGELTAQVQVKLLRVLEERAVRRVGSVKSRPIDVRFVAATNRNLEEEASNERFRKDLYFRLAGVTLVVPPLRERKNEIVALAEAFLERAARQLPVRRRLKLSALARERLEQYSWPGNVRELKNAIERAALLCDSDTIGVEHLPVERMSSGWMSEDPGGEGEGERARIVEALQQCGGNQSQAAKLLGISRGTLISRLDQYRIPRPQKR